MADTLPSKVQESSGRIMAWVKSHPWIAGIILVGVAVLAYIAYKNNANASGTPAADATPSSSGTAPTDTGAAIPGAPIPDTTNMPIPLPQISGGGGGGGGGGGTKKTALTSPALLAPATTITSADLSQASINDATWAYAQLTGGPDLSVQPGQNIFADPTAEALINQVGGDPATGAALNQIVSGATPGGQSGAAMITDFANTPVSTPGARALHLGDVVPSQTQSQAAGGDVLSNIIQAASGFFASLAAPATPAPTSKVHAAAVQAPASLADSLFSQINANQIDAAINQAVGSQVLPTFPTTAGVKATANIPASKPKVIKSITIGKAQGNIVASNYKAPNANTPVSTARVRALHDR